MAHHEQLGITLLHRFPVKLQRALVEPSRPWLLIVMKGEPDVWELTDLRVVLAPPQVDDVGYAEGSQLLYVGLGLDCASEREPFAHEESVHRLAPLSVPNRPRRLENLYFVNAVSVRFVPVESVTYSLPAG